MPHEAEVLRSHCVLLKDKIQSICCSQALHLEVACNIAKVRPCSLKPSLSSLVWFLLTSLHVSSHFGGGGGGKFPDHLILGSVSLKLVAFLHALFLSYCFYIHFTVWTLSCL